MKMYRIILILTTFILCGFNCIDTQYTYDYKSIYVDSNTDNCVPKYIYEDGLCFRHSSVGRTFADTIVPCTKEVNDHIQKCKPVDIKND